MRQVELVVHGLLTPENGIGRYAAEIYRRLQAQIDIRLSEPLYPPFAGRFPLLTHFPRGLKDYRAGSIVHFTQIMGCAQMLWHPLRPAIATVHDLGALVCREDELLFDRLGRWALDLSLSGLKRMDRLVADSHFTARGLIDVLGVPHSRVRVVHLGVEGDQFHSLPGARGLIAQKYDVPPAKDTYNLLYVGNEQPRKNLGVLLEALARLKARGIPFRLIKVGGAGGDRWRARFLAHASRMGIEDQILLVGRVPEADLPAFYSAADLYVTSSLLEGFGLPVLEAMACAVPVVCSRAGSLPEIAEDVALLVDPRDPHALAAAIDRVLDDDVLRREMGARDVNRARQFPWEKSAENLLQIYREFGEDLDG
ncbi:MAG: glycosyltransferase family 1 protein [Anaerolineae bacterium]|jgi:glycosyltransferase involved in cell wall biosynthesis